MLAANGMSGYNSVWRMGRPVFEGLVQRLSPLLGRADTNLHRAIPARQRVAIGLFYMANDHTLAVRAEWRAATPCRRCVYAGLLKDRLWRFD